MHESTNRSSMNAISNDAWDQRTRMLWGEERYSQIRQSHVLVVGIGGVGGAALQALARAGVGRLSWVDSDIVDITNINRQMVASLSSVGQYKASVMQELLREINPDAEMHPIQMYIDETNISTLFDGAHYDFVIDAIDTLTPKCVLIQQTLERNIPLISAMGAGAKDDPFSFRIAPIRKTHHCGLAKAVRTKLREMQCHQSFDCLFSEQPPIASAVYPIASGEGGKRSLVGTVSYMPQMAGLHLAAYVLQHLLEP